jgi:endo-1,4-beta-xylanase
MEFKKESMTNSDQNINKILQRKRSLKISRGYMNRNISVIIMSVLLALPVISRGSYKPGQATERAILLSQFISTDIRIDGIAEAVWNNVKPSRIGVSMTGNLSARAAECPTYGNVRSLWDGALLYLLIDVSDNDVTSAGRRATDKDGVEIYLDLWNDKFPKNEEDDGIIRISCQGELSGSGVYADRLNAYAASLKYNNEKVITGYTVELAINIGGITMENGSLIGIDFCINDAVSPANSCKYRVFWNNGNNRGLDDNSMWGDVMLDNYDGKTPKVPDTYMLKTNIKKAEALAHGIWVSESDIDKAVAEANSALQTTMQTKIDAANTILDNAIKNLRRRGKYPDPFDLPAVNYLPDPFTFLNGGKVKTVADWSKRRDEIRDLVQYYEYGYMPEAPEAVTASLDGSNVVINVKDKGKTASFNARLTVPTVNQCGKPGAYPVIVSIDFFASAGNAIYLNAGYAVLSLTYSGIASDNKEHNGAFYALYPYDVTTGHDAGTLLAWAWGASRGVDALIYLAKNDPSYANTFDLKKLVVTGFSRCGKAALVAGLMDERFGVVNPGASGCGGAAAYRYDSFGNTPYRTAPFGNIYAWGVSTGCEVLGDRIRHQGHNSNEMLARFLNPGRMYKSNTNGYGERLPYDHHEIIAAIAPRAVIITTADNDYANAAEGDCLSVEGAKSVFRFLNAGQNLALNLRTTDITKPQGPGGGHRLDNDQISNLVAFSNMVYYGKPLPEELNAKLYANPYYPIYDTYYGGLKTMMPWIDSAPDTPASN